MRINSVRFPKASAQNAPAMKGHGRAKVKYNAPTSPSNAKPRAICQEPPNPRLHHVQVPKMGNSARIMRRAIDLVSTPAKPKKKKTHSPAINAVKTCAAKLPIHPPSYKRPIHRTL